MGIFNQDETNTVASTVLDGAVVRIAADITEAFKEEFLQALVLLDDVGYQRQFAKIKPYLSATGSMRDFRAAVRVARNATKATDRPKDMLVRGDQAELADRFLEILSKDPEEIVHDEGHLWIYRNGTWNDMTTPHYMTLIKKMAGMVTMEGPLNMSYSTARGVFDFACDTVHKEQFFSEAPRGITFRNGFISVSPTGEIQLTPHAPENRARHRYEFDYQPNISCSAWTTALDVWFRDDDDKQQKIDCLQEMAGAALLGLGPKYEKFHLLMGSGEEGKSTFIKILKGAMPPGTTCAVSPQDWSNEYRLAMLSNKRLNVVAELPGESILCSELFKGIITGDSVTGREIRESPFTFDPIATHVFAGNMLPEIKDLTHGFWRRPNIIKYNRAIAESEKNKNIVTDVLGAEFPGLVAWMVAGGARLVQNKTYTIPSSSTLEVAAWRLMADQVMAYIGERCIPCDHNDGVLATELYNDYLVWHAQNTDLPVLSQNSFGRRMKSHKKPSARSTSGNRYPVRIRPADTQSGPF